MITAVALGACSHPRYSLRPDPTNAERKICGRIGCGANVDVRAFSRRWLRKSSLAGERAAIESTRILFDIVSARTTADPQGHYCLTLPDDDEYALSFTLQGAWATVVWTEKTGGSLDVELPACTAPSLLEQHDR